MAWRISPTPSSCDVCGASTHLKHTTEMGRREVYGIPIIFTVSEHRCSDCAPASIRKKAPKQ